MDEVSGTKITAISILLKVLMTLTDKGTLSKILKCWHHTIKKANFNMTFYTSIEVKNENLKFKLE